MTDGKEKIEIEEKSGDKPETEKPQEKKGDGRANPQPFVLPLRKPVIANGETVDTLTFREPTGADIEAVGNPVNMDFSHDPPKVSFDSRAMTQMMARLALVPPSTIRKMHPRDWNSAAWNLAGFFMPD
jgi:hypothetical protein